MAIGYWMNPNSVQPVIMIIFLFFSLFGGLWFPVTGGLRTFAQGTPTYRIVQIATDVVTHGTVSWIPVSIILIWLAVVRRAGDVRGQERGRGDLTMAWNRR